jgi:hypothetical protein
MSADCFFVFMKDGKIIAKQGFDTSIWERLIAGAWEVWAKDKTKQERECMIVDRIGKEHVKDDYPTGCLNGHQLQDALAEPMIKIVESGNVGVDMPIIRVYTKNAFKAIDKAYASKIVIESEKDGWGVERPPKEDYDYVIFLRYADHLSLSGKEFITLDMKRAAPILEKIDQVYQAWTALEKEIEAEE